MNYREFIEKQAGKKDATFEYSFPLTEQHVLEQAGSIRKFFSTKAVKQDMDDFVKWQLTGYAQMNEGAMRACFDNGASKENFTADDIAEILKGCTTEFADITKELIQVNDLFQSKNNMKG